MGVVAVDDDDAADLNEAPVGTLNQRFTHCNGDLMKILRQSGGVFFQRSIDCEGREVVPSCRELSTGRRWMLLEPGKSPMTF